MIILKGERRQSSLPSVCYTYIVYVFSKNKKNDLYPCKYQLYFEDNCMCFPRSSFALTGSKLYQAWGRGGSVVELRTPEREVQGSNQQLQYIVLEQDTLTFQRYWKRWLRPKMTEKLLTGTFNNKKPTNVSS